MVSWLKTTKRSWLAVVHKQTPPSSCLSWMIPLQKVMHFSPLLFWPKLPPPNHPLHHPLHPHLYADNHDALWWFNPPSSPSHPWPHQSPFSSSTSISSLIPFHINFSSLITIHSCTGWLPCRHVPWWPPDPRKQVIAKKYDERCARNMKSSSNTNTRFSNEKYKLKGSNCPVTPFCWVERRTFCCVFQWRAV